MDEEKWYVSHSLFSFGQIPKINIFYKVTGKHLEEIEETWNFIFAEVLDTKEEAEYGLFDNGGAPLGEEN